MGSDDGRGDMKICHRAPLYLNSVHQEPLVLAASAWSIISTSSPNVHIGSLTSAFRTGGIR
jgi:hypothetical protein